MARIGYLACSNKNDAPSFSKQGEVLVSFDSGASISFADAGHNTLVCGSTGSGKTSSVILPACRNLFQAGFGGLVIDVKGNLVGQVRKLAGHCGREEDIIEYGTAPSAQPVNILHGMSRKEAYEFFSLLGKTMAPQDDRNAYWHLQGFKIAADVYELLRILKAAKGRSSAIPATIASVTEILNDPPLAWKLFDYFLQTPVEAEGAAQSRLVRKVEADTFHLLKKEKKDDEHYAAQTVWRLSGIRNALDLFMETPGLCENFAASGREIGLEQLIYKRRKIVVLSFAATAGEMANVMARHMIQQYYQTVLKKGLSAPEGQYTFLVADEFQDIANFESHNRWNDNVFTAKSREFKSIQLFATQGVSALLSRGSSTAQMMEFMNNCNNKLFFYSDDMLSQDTAERFDAGIALAKLEPGKCLMSRYDASARKRINGLETIQREHDNIAELLAKAKNAPRVCAKRKAHRHRSVEEVLSMVMGKEENMKVSNGVEQKAKREKEHKEKLKALKEAKALPEHTLKLIENYPAFFPCEAWPSLDIPVGWGGHVEKSIRTVIATAGGIIQETGINRYASLAVLGGSVVGLEAQGRLSATTCILNRLLRAIPLCPICGETIEPGELCDACWTKFGLPQASPEPNKKFATRRRTPEFPF